MTNLVRRCGVRQIITGLLALATAGWAAAQAADAPTRRLDMSDAAVEQRLQADVFHLASDALEGRGVRTKGLDQAAEFIAQEFAAAGLDTRHYQGTPFHEFRLYSSKATGAVQELVLAAENGPTRTLTLGADYTSLMVVPKKSFHLPVVFAGYGITDRKLGYDDYAGVNVAGKAVIVLRHEPQRGRKDSPFAGEDNSQHAYVATKIRNAADHGAAALILCTDEYEVQQARRAAGDPQAQPAEALLDAELNGSVNGSVIPVVHCRRSLVADWIRPAFGRELAEVEAEIDRTLQPQSRELPSLAIDGKTAVTRSGRTLRNVVASLEGRGPLAEETLIIGAHYDHLGRGGWGSLALGADDQIHNGADDNASGTAVLIEAARLLAAQRDALRRRIVFIAFSAEELGLIGSRRYVQDPLVPLRQTIAMLNLDMVGRLRNDQLTVYGVKTAAEWPKWVADAAAQQQLGVIPKSGGYGPSDHATFYERGIPVLHFFTGFHPQYHRPEDDAERLNVAGMRRITRMLVDVALQIDRADEKPRLNRVDELADLEGDASLEALLGGSSPAGKPRLGIQLEKTPERDAVRIKQVVRASAAEQAGLRAGDVLLQLDAREMRSISDVQDFVKACQRGQTVRVEFERGGVRRQLELKF